ncbi:MAG: hypothetical protein J3K34DRAFT_407974 [Monoraphidium minutum]|nr:MAG: hypothetical protein J3K34DRAFT_407974 [Monoraphidium minutum]
MPLFGDIDRPPARLPGASLVRYKASCSIPQLLTRPNPELDRVVYPPRDLRLLSPARREIDGHGREHRRGQARRRRHRRGRGVAAQGQRGPHQERRDQGRRRRQEGAAHQVMTRPHARSAGVKAPARRGRLPAAAGALAAAQARPSQTLPAPPAPRPPACACARLCALARRLLCRSHRDSLHPLCIDPLH